MKRLTFLAMVCFGLAACSVIPTPEQISECFLRREVFVWADADGDGNFDQGEEPLNGVSAVITPVGSTRSFSGRTDQDGYAEINGIGDFGRFCDELALEITIPEGYEPSTPARLSLAGLPPGDPLIFGLVPPASE